MAGGEFALPEHGELADYRDAVTGQAPLHCGARPPQHRDRLVSEKVGGFAPAEHREAARVVEIGGDLGEELVVAQPDRHANRKRGFDPSGKGGE